MSFCEAYKDVRRSKTTRKRRGYAKFWRAVINALRPS